MKESGLQPSMHWILWYLAWIRVVAEVCAFIHLVGGEAFAKLKLGLNWAACASRIRLCCKVIGLLPGMHVCEAACDAAVFAVMQSTGESPTDLGHVLAEKNGNWPGQLMIAEPGGAEDPWLAALRLRPPVVAWEWPPLTV